MTRIKVGHICSPGLWERAPMFAPDGVKATCTAINPALACVHLGINGAHAPAIYTVEDDWSVNLDDGIGLGLHGLSATVASRKGYRDADTMRLNLGEPEAVSHYKILRSLHSYHWAPTGFYEAESDAERWIMLSTFFRLTDDLCDAVGLERKGNEVAQWERGGGTWSIWVRDPEEGRVGRVFAIREDNWQHALEAALKGAR